MASVLISYGVVLVVLGLWLRQPVPASGEVASIAGLAGGVLCLLWGGAAMLRLKGRAWAILTTLAVAFVLLVQTVHVWTQSSGVTLAVRLLVTAMMVLTVGMLMYLFHGERPPEFYQVGSAPRDDATANANDAPQRSGRSRR